MAQEQVAHLRVFLPANRKEYEVDIPIGLNTHVAALLTAQALQSSSEGYYIASRDSFLARVGTGDMLDREKTIKENGIQSGDYLMLV